MDSDSWGSWGSWGSWDWTGADEEFKAAIALNPSLAEARWTYSHLLTILKRPGEAIDQIGAALRLDPLNPELLAFYGQDLLMLRRYDEAITQFNAALRIAPEHILALAGLRDVYYQKQMYAQSFDVQLHTIGDPAVKAAVQQGYAEGGYVQASSRGCEVAAARSRATKSVLGGVVRYCINANRFDEALDWLERSYELHSPNMVYIGAMPLYDPIRGTPRFQALVRRLNLPG